MGTQYSESDRRKQGQHKENSIFRECPPFLRTQIFCFSELTARGTDGILYTMNKRITFDVSVMGGRPCIRGMRVTVGTVVGLVASGHSREQILELYPYLEDADIADALEYAAWRAEEIDVPFVPA